MVFTVTLLFYSYYGIHCELTVLQFLFMHSDPITPEMLAGKLQFGNNAQLYTRPKGLIVQLGQAEN